MQSCTLRKIIMPIATLAAFVAGCGAEPSDEVQTLDRAALTGDPVQQGRQIVDDAAQTVRDAYNSGGAEMDALTQQLDTHVTQLHGLNLTASQQAQVESYAQTVGQQLQPLVSQIIFNNPAPAQAAFEEICFSRCRIFLEFACENGALIGACAGWWNCAARRGEHPCLQPNSELCGDDLCVAPERCSRQLFGRDRCVRTCTTDADCRGIGRERCRQPLFTAFRRCV